MNAVLGYLKSCPKVDFVVVADDDIYVNPFTVDELKSRFKEAAYGNAKVVVSSEQTCWLGRVCEPGEANEWLNTIRNASGHPEISQFPNSQYAGERQAVIKMLERMVQISSDDQEAIAMTMKEHPTEIALDYQEKLFMSFDRGLMKHPNGRILCNFGGDKSRRCAWSGFAKLRYTWGECKAEGARIFLRDEVPYRKDWNAPLMFHLNGPVRKVIWTGKNCTTIFNKILPPSR
jgi:hypothetical protein